MPYFDRLFIVPHDTKIINSIKIKEQFFTEKILIIDFARGQATKTP